MADGFTVARGGRTAVASGPGREGRVTAGLGVGFAVGLDVGATVLVTVGAGLGVRVGPAHGRVAPLAPLARPEGRPVTTTLQADPHPTRGKPNLTVGE